LRKGPNPRALEGRVTQVPDFHFESAQMGTRRTRPSELSVWRGSRETTQASISGKSGTGRGHPHAGPVVNSDEELQARIQAREATEQASLPVEPYKVYDPVIAEVHRIREQLAREREPASSGLTHKDEPPRQG
jgi:hypothetical protein